ncbi:OmpA family protein [Sungkyunkwania multivorans]|uniref:OmpA family protein n=1 Tax=Sungkyunkwania multivorans TaxID=1173618 RepID=A0ABW3CXY5_9FLAO
MKKLILLSASILILASCASKKEMEALQAKQQETEDLLNAASMKLNLCLEEKAGLTAKAQGLESQVTALNRTNGDLIKQIGDLTTLTSKGATNLEKSLESLKEKDLRIQRLQDAMSRKDSVTLALVTSLKGVLGNLADDDIQVNVEKGVVFVSISDKLLFKSGSYTITDRAKEVLGKVAKVVNNKPDFEFMVEGHTDDVPIKRAGIKDNWDLSVLRATAVVRTLQNDFGVAPERMTAAGRSYYVPVTENDSAADRARNRRTRIVVLPKLDQFYNMIEEGMKQASAGGK